MPKGPAPLWKQRLPALDDHLAMSMTLANGIHNEHGHYAECVYAGCADEERAREVVRMLYRSTRALNNKLRIARKGQVSLRQNIVKAADGTYQVKYQLVDKTAAYKYVLETYGEDRSKWPYDPRAKKEKK